MKGTHRYNYASYEPMKVSCRRKVNLCDLPVRERREIVSLRSIFIGVALLIMSLALLAYLKK